MGTAEPLKQNHPKSAIVTIEKNEKIKSYSPSNKKTNSVLKNRCKQFARFLLLDTFAFGA